MSARWRQWVDEWRHINLRSVFTNSTFWRGYKIFLEEPTGIGESQRDGRGEMVEVGEDDDDFIDYSSAVHTP